MTYLAGQRFRAGYGVATVLADMDFETFSEAGYVWDAAANKWAGLPGAPKNKRGLAVVGAALYSMHPSCEVLSFAYDLKDGRGARHWRPGEPNPQELFDHMAAGRSVEAWNVGFERWVWLNVCMPRYGWPAPGELRCAMAKARAFSLPGALDNAGAVMQLTQQKDADGKRLLDKFSKPRNPTKADPRRRILPAQEPEDGARLYAYNARDIAAEAEASLRVPDLEGEELEFWKCDQAINARGVAIDRASVAACVRLINDAHERYNGELAQLTGGAVTSASQVEKLLGWLGAYRVYASSLDEESVDELLKNRAKYPAAAVRALEIRAAIGSASVKKVFAMANRVTPAGRLHDLFNYYAAHTGRATGEAVQPTNLAREGPPVYKCGHCGHYHGTHAALCPWCGVPRAPGKSESDWCLEAVEDALTCIHTGSLDAVEHVFGEAMSALAGCLRGLFVAAPGCDLLASDYSAIEAVVLAMIAGEQWRIDVFRTHGKIYEMSASKITGVPFEEYQAYRAREGKHHPTRQTIGKVAELACFVADTQVLTDSGYKRIVEVQTTDKLWDGIEWVKHAGLVAKGPRKVIKLAGVLMTPTHPISTGLSWRAASELASNASMLSRALAIGSANLPLFSSSKERTAGCAPCGRNAIAGRSTPWLSATYFTAALRAVTPALKKQVRGALNFIGLTSLFAQTKSIGAGYSTASLRAFNAATIPKMPDTPTTMAGGFSFLSLGEKIKSRFSRTLSRCPDGTIPLWSLTGKMSIKGTSRATCDSLPKGRTSLTVEASKSCKSESMNLRPVYDIAHAGPRNRFTIATSDGGHLIVHNSGYQGWVGAWSKFGADAFMNEEQMKDAILKWRAASPAIVELWGGQERRNPWRKEFFGVEGAAIQAIWNPGREYPVMRLDGTPSGIRFVRDTTPAFGLSGTGGPLYCYLPSGRALTYHNPRLSESDRGLSISYERWNTNPANGPIGWIDMRTWGGRLVENIVQATARDILRHAIVNLERCGYPVVLHVYDEIVCELPESVGELAQFEKIMATMPPWAAGWPIKADGGWRGPRYRKS